MMITVHSFCFIGLKHDIDDHDVRKEATNILDTLGHLPPAIDQAGAYIRDKSIPSREIVENYRSRQC